MPTLRIPPLAPHEARVVAVPDGLPPKRSIVVVHDGENVRAFWNVCQHLPIPLDGGTGIVDRGEAGALLCNTHGAVYAVDTGRCVEGPCVGAVLETVAVERQDDADLLRW